MGAPPIVAPRNYGGVMFGSRPFTMIAALLFGLVAVLHTYRLVTHFQIIVGDHVIAQVVSWIGVIVAAVLSYGLFREARR